MGTGAGGRRPQARPGLSEAGRVHCRHRPLTLLVGLRGAGLGANAREPLEGPRGLGGCGDSCAGAASTLGRGRGLVRVSVLSILNCDLFLQRSLWVLSICGYLKTDQYLQENRGDTEAYCE